MRFSDQFLDEIRDHLPISQVVGEFVSWDKRKSQPARGDFWACCPFHNEKTPSFHADDRRGRYHCFGCGVSGDHFRFLTEKAGMSFPEAVETLARRAGVPMPARDEEAEAADRKRTALTDVMELATRYFEEALAANIGARVRGYLQEREVAPAIQRRFRLGYAPDSRNGLKEYLAQNGVTADAMQQAGLVVTGDDIAVPYDRFRNRLIFPIADMRGRIVAFGGRAMSDDMPAKYLNSPETPVFSKRRTLYNGLTARQAARDGKPLIVVEGYMDVIAMVGAGFEGALAPLGTALTEEHIDMLWRMSPNPILAFDGDEAGRRASDRAIDLILPQLKPGFSASILSLPDGLDPDDLIRQRGREAIVELLGIPTPLADAVWARETRGAIFETPESRAALEQKLRQTAGVIADASVRRHYLQAFEERIAAFFRPEPVRRAPDSGSWGRGQGRSASRRSPRYVVSDALKNSRLLREKSSPAITPREAAIVMSLVNNPELAESRLESLAVLELVSSIPRAVLAALLDLLGQGHPDAKAVREKMAVKGYQDDILSMETLLARQGVWQAGTAANAADAETGLRHALALHNKKVQLNRELKAAEIAHGNHPSEESFERLRDIQNQISSVDGTEALIEGFGSLSGRPARNL